MARVRIHQHVNPLAKYYRELPVEPIDPEDFYSDPGLGIHLDIGCGRGGFLLKMAEENRERNFLGVEIREPLVDEANEKAKKKGLDNLHYVFCNATIDLDKLLANLESDRIEYVTIQFPDPWFKKRHAKRRMVKDAMIEAIAQKLSPKARVLVQTDVEFLFGEMKELFLQSGFIGEDISENPLEVKTERETSVERRNLPVYRCLLKRK